MLLRNVLEYTNILIEIEDDETTTNNLIQMFAFDTLHLHIRKIL